MTLPKIITVPAKLKDYPFCTGIWKAPIGLRVRITVLEARKAYGRLELRITPDGGEGQAWVQEKYVTLTSLPLK